MDWLWLRAILARQNSRSLMVDADWLEIGTIVSAQGLQGEVRVLSLSDFPERFTQPGQRWLRRAPGAEPEAVELVRGRPVPGKNLYIVRLAAVSDRTQAEALRGATLLVSDAELPELDEDEFHVAELIGLTVIDQASGEVVGEVIDLRSAGNDLLEVRRADDPTKTVLIPFVKAIVPVVDLEGDRLEITPPPGLI